MLPILFYCIWFRLADATSRMVDLGETHFFQRDLTGGFQKHGKDSFFRFSGKMAKLFSAEPSAELQVQERKKVEVRSTRLNERTHFVGLSNVLAELYTASLSQLVWFLVNFGFLAGTPEAGGCNCRNLEKSVWRLEETEKKVLWRCRGCRKTMSVFARDQDFFDAKLSVRAMAGILWIFCSNLHLSPDKSSLLLGVGHRVIRLLFQKFAEFYVPLIDRLNGSLTVGGLGQDVALDEISFRSVGRAHGIVWLRYLAVVRRGSSLLWIEPLPYRISSAGQGGGGPISLQEMREVLLLDADESILGVGSSTESANRMEVLMHQAVRLYQFKYWFGGHNLFSVFGKLRQVEREAPGSLTWASLAHLKSVDHTVQKELLEEEASVEADDDSDA
ncbi:hypothetical protein AK812_SmicGene1387 [Symbiodinium microadriaticum]|uniref:Uncharacterized protein n=1 Tax=Symbiodinium microadriaticum TaxID=2951 RepID=A0A1Q9F438_SYMMI|nr:hypothetical protein AK812_SmicGene1387 [Symbiodinium microadriaticum]